MAACSCRADSSRRRRRRSTDGLPDLETETPSPVEEQEHQSTYGSSKTPRTKRRRRSRDGPPDLETETSSPVEEQECQPTYGFSKTPRTKRFSDERPFSKYISKSVKLDDGPPVRHQLRAERQNLDRLSDEDSKLRRFTVGTRNGRYKNRTVLLVGATGSGKSTLINALVNFVMGVKFEDKVWFEVVVDGEEKSQSDSQTSAVSVYEVFGFEGQSVPYSLTIIDTPGYGDTEGISNDEIIKHSLKDLYPEEEQKWGVRTIDAVGLVLKASENRLDERTTYIFNSVTSLFGKDMEQNFVALMTHSPDRRKPKNALKALEDAKITYARDENNEPVYFLFSNCQKENIEDSSEDDAKRLFQLSEDGMKNFTEFLGQSRSLSLKTTMEVIKERIRLTACIQNLKERVENIEMKQEVIKRNREELSRYREEVIINRNFTIKVEEVYIDKETIEGPSGWIPWFQNPGATTCNNCKENCHYPGCTWAMSPSLCEVMKNGKCTSCRGKCPVEDHVRENWRYVTKTRTVTKTIKEMKAKYEESIAKAMEKTSLLDHMVKEITTLTQEKNKYLNKAFKRIEKLERIALNVDSVSTYVHLDFLIQKMEEREDTEKVQKLQRMRDRMDKRNKAAADYHNHQLQKLSQQKYKDRDVRV